MISRALAEAGAANVYVAGRRADVLDAAVKSIGAAEGVVVPVVCDVTSQENLKSFVSRVEEEAGFLNLLICNSGIAGPQVPAPVVCPTPDRHRHSLLETSKPSEEASSSSMLHAQTR